MPRGLSFLAITLAVVGAIAACGGRTTLDFEDYDHAAGTGGGGAGRSSAGGTHSAGGHSNGGAGHGGALAMGGASGAGFGGVTSTGGNGGSGGFGGTPDRPGPPRLHTEGRWFKDPDGNTVILRGLATADLRDLETDRGSMNIEKFIDLVSDANRGWYAKVLRFTVFPERWFDDANYLDLYLRPAVEHATERGLYVIIDWHEVQNSSWARTETLDFWNYVAPLFADYPNVLYEPFNEAINQNDPSWSTWKTDAQAFVDAIRIHAPKTVILISGPQWAQLIGGAATDPLQGDDIAYVGHIYPEIDPFVWGPNGDITRVAKTRPLLITEWGYWAGGAVPTDGTESDFGTPLKAYIREHELGWVAWCADTQWAPPMFDTIVWNLRTGPDQMGGFARDWLAEDAGK